MRAYGELTGRVSIVPKRQVCTSRLVVRRYGLVFLPSLHRSINTYSYRIRGSLRGHFDFVYGFALCQLSEQNNSEVFPSVVLVLVCCWQTETLLRFEQVAHKTFFVEF